MSATQDWIRLVNTFGVFTGRCFAFICPSAEFEEGGANSLRIYWVLPFHKSGEEDVAHCEPSAGSTVRVSE